MGSDKGGSKTYRPPIHILLLYAADGLSVYERNLSAAGRPRTPERNDWVAPFRELVETPEGQERLKELVKAGLRGWGCPAVYDDCADAAFRYLGFRAEVIKELAHFAATAREPFTLPEPPRHPPARDTRPRPERAKPMGPGPSGQKPRPKGPRPGPG